MAGDAMFPFPGPGADVDAVVADTMFRRRLVMARGRLDAELAGRTVAQLLTLDALADDPIDLHLDVEGDDLDAVFAVIDAIDTIGAPVRVRLAGRAGGLAVAVLAVGAERVVAPHARALVSEPVASFDGRPESVANWAEAHRTRLADLVGRLASATGRSEGEIRQIITESAVLDAERLVALSIADRIDVP
ncbi:MAG: ATP-dependent Clp protease proteolytic subunit [Actinomycetota bacterium]|nr:ATP-dependent Clp protease proteolytic subunit [Actinomycetota bacterium]